MRRLLTLAILAASAASVLASSAVAQPAVTRRTPNPAAPLAPVPRPADAPTPAAFATSTVAADLTGLSVRIEQDEARLTQLRDPELARQNQVLAAIKPALAFHGNDWFPAKY